jgi:hypothetical protein
MRYVSGRHSSGNAFLQFIILTLVRATCSGLRKVWNSELLQQRLVRAAMIHASDIRNERQAPPIVVRLAVIQDT